MSAPSTVEPDSGACDQPPALRRAKLACPRYRPSKDRHQRQLMTLAAPPTEELRAQIVDARDAPLAEPGEIIALDRAAPPAWETHDLDGLQSTQ